MDNEANIKKNKNKPLILVADDVDSNLKMLSSLMEKNGFDTIKAEGGKQAIEMAYQYLPDLILLDIMMPEVDGFEVCEELKINPNTCEIPIIFITGKSDPGDIIKSLRIGAADYVTKPYNIVELSSRVKTHIELKRSKDEIKKYHKELEEARSELEKINKNKDIFFSIIAHDLKGAFSGFIGLSELLFHEFSELKTDEIMQIVSSMNNSAHRLYNFLDNILEWSRSQMGRVEFNPTPFDIADIVSKNLIHFAPMANDKNIDLISAVEPNTFIYADSNMLNTVIRNLISNAIKFTRGGGEVKVFTNGNDNQNISLSIQDTGVGIHENDLKKLFRIDKKFSNPGTNEEIGTGLGLILCKELIERNGGSITVNSRLGHGSKFTVKIPKAI